MSILIIVGLLAVCGINLCFKTRLNDFAAGFIFAAALIRMLGWLT